MWVESRVVSSPPMMRFTWVAIALCSVGLLACSQGSSTGGPSDDDDLAIDASDDDSPDATVTDADPEDGPAPDATSGLPRFERCVGRPFVPAAALGFATVGGTVAASAGSANHSVEDTLSTPTPTPHLIARFGYGVLNAALGSEPVAVSIDDCSGWRSLGEPLTDSGGLLDVPVELPLGPGVYETRFVVRGDASQTKGFLWLAPAGTHLMITDIDGTLTTSDTELFLQLLNGSYVPAAYPGGTGLTAAHAAKGHIVIYLTGRPYWLTTQTRDWLTNLGFAQGPLHLAPSNSDILPTDTSVGAYKKAWLEGLVAKGFVLDLAYGNATTDIFAYTGSGIPASQQWIIGANAGAGGTHAVMDSWTERITEVEQQPSVSQPFAY